MSLQAYQKQVDDLLQNYETPYWSALSQLAHMSEELGEVARALNHKYGDKVSKPTDEPDDLAGELGDLLFCILCLANSEGIDLDEPLQKTIGKLSGRDKDRFEKKANP